MLILFTFVLILNLKELLRHNFNVNSFQIYFNFKLEGTVRRKLGVNSIRFILISNLKELLSVDVISGFILQDQNYFQTSLDCRRRFK